MSESYADLGGQPGTPRPKPKRVHKPHRDVGDWPSDGCQHTTDPHGWLMDGDGNITGKCACWGGG